MHREQLMSTGIGRYLGIPHIRFESVIKPIIALGIQRNGITGYDTIDNLPVKVVFMILCGNGQHKEHIKILSQIVSIMKQNDNIMKIIEADRVDDVYRLLVPGK